METFSALLAHCAGNSPVPVNSPHKGQWRAALMFSLICAWINDWVNNREAGDLRRHRGHYDVTVMLYASANCVLSVPIMACHLFGAWTIKWTNAVLWSHLNPKEQFRWGWNQNVQLKMSPGKRGLFHSGRNVLKSIARSGSKFSVAEKMVAAIYRECVV